MADVWELKRRARARESAVRSGRMPSPEAMKGVKPGKRLKINMEVPRQRRRRMEER